MGTPESEPVIRTGQITFTPKAVELYTNEFLLRKTITQEQGQEVTSVLKEKGPQEAIQKLAFFLEKIDSTET